MSSLTAEFLGTMVLILFGNGVVANVVLAKTKGNSSGWIVITAGWGFAVYVAAMCAQGGSEAHLNPALTLSAFLVGKCGFFKMIGYIMAQMLGAMVGAALVYFFYQNHFEETQDPNAKLACFCTAPNIRGNGQAFLCEVIGTVALILPLLLAQSAKLVGGSGSQEVVSKIDLGAIGLVPVALLVFAIGLSLGGTTGYAINPARDLGPRLMHHWLPIPGKRDADWDYAPIPVAGPMAGAVLAAILYGVLA